MNVRAVMDTRLTRVGGLAVVVALLAGLALLAGPLAQPARALAFDVATEAEFAAAINQVNTTDGAHTITLLDHLDFTEWAGFTLEFYDGPDGSPKDVTIDGNGWSVTCDAEEGTCSNWLTSEIGGEGSLTIREVSVSGFQEGVIYTSNTDLTVIDAEFSDNANVNLDGPDSMAFGGVISATASGPGSVLTVTDSIFDYNTAYAGLAYGGAIYTQVPLVVTGSSFSGNRAESYGEDAHGGAVFADATEAYFTDSTLDDNEAYGGNSSGDGLGGAIKAVASYVRIETSTLESNYATGQGGAVHLHGGSSLSIDESLFEGNDASFAGGAVALSGSGGGADSTTFRGNSAGSSGGALVVRDESYFEVNQSLFTENEAGRGGAVGVYGLGFDDRSVLEAYDSTFAFNEASGGAAFQGTDAEIALWSVTVANNDADPIDLDAVYGGQILGQWLNLELEATVIVEPGDSENCFLMFEHTVTAGAYNRSDDTTCFADGDTDVASTSYDAMLGPLQFNGGPTHTMLPAPESELVDAWPTGIQGGCSAETEDQRSVLRPQGDACDIGAVEIFEPIDFSVSTPGGTVEVRVLNADDAEGAHVALSELTPAPPAGVAFPYGSIALGMEVWDDGWPVDVEVATLTPTNEFWKHYDGAWIEYPATKSLGDGYTIWSFRLIDGADGDNDLTENAIIIDPVALGVGAAFTG